MFTYLLIHLFYCIAGTGKTMLAKAVATEVLHIESPSFLLFILPSSRRISYLSYLILLHPCASLIGGVIHKRTKEETHQCHTISHHTTSHHTSNVHFIKVCALYKQLHCLTLISISTFISISFSFSFITFDKKSLPSSYFYSHSYDFTNSPQLHTAFF